MSYDDAAATGICPNVVSYNKANSTKSGTRNSRDNAADVGVVQSSIVGLALLTCASILFSLLL